MSWWRDGSVRHGFENMPLLNVRMAARLHGFPDHWHYVGSKTHAYRQVGNAFPPPVAEAVGRKIAEAIRRFADAQPTKASGMPDTDAAATSGKARALKRSKSPVAT